MSAPKCPFQTPIIAKDFACRLGQDVTVRNTPQVHCQSAQALQRCRKVYDHLKAVALPALGMEDDLASTPHNVYLKIQYGGLLGLQAMVGATTDQPGKIADIHAVIEAVTRGGDQTNNIAYSELISLIETQQIRRRRKRGR